MTTKEEILALAGKPVAWVCKKTGLTTISDRAMRQWVADGYEMTPLYTANQVLAARKDLEQEVERLKVERDNHQLDINAELRQQLTKMTEIARKEYLSAIDWAGKHQELSEQLAEKDAEIELLKAMVVMRFDHDTPPQFEQGYDEHEVLEPVTAEHCQWFVSEIESLRQQLAAAQALAKYWSQKHDEAQVREQQLLEALHYSLGAWHYDGVSDEHGSIFQEANDRCNQPQDTTALEAIVEKAGEVMRERSATVCDKRSTYYGRASAESQEAKDCAFNIRAMPGVTLEDLK